MSQDKLPPLDPANLAAVTGGLSTADSSQLLACIQSMQASITNSQKSSGTGFEELFPLLLLSGMFGRGGGCPCGCGMGSCCH
jgi:hypothetical protein